MTGNTNSGHMSSGRTTANGDRERRSRWIPWTFVWGFVVILAANGIMVFFAFDSFTGISTDDAYRRGLGFNEQVEARQRAETLGWQVAARLDSGAADRRLVLALHDRAGRALSSAQGPRRVPPADRTGPGLHGGPDAARRWPLRRAGPRAAPRPMAGAVPYRDGRRPDHRRTPLRPGLMAVSPDMAGIAAQRASPGRATSVSAPAVREISLHVDGMHCGACIARVEGALSGMPGVELARANLTQGRVRVRWRDGGGRRRNRPAPTMATNPATASSPPCAPPVTTPRSSCRRACRAGPLPKSARTVRCMAVAGFAAANVMLLSLSIWTGHAEGMAAETRSLFHWFSALIALPALAWAGRPFFRSALKAVRNGRTNMDVPIRAGGHPGGGGSACGRRSAAGRMPISIRRSPCCSSC